MAVTALWAVHGTHRDILDYVMNPEKTENPDYSLCKVLNYAENDEKTEKKFFVTGINCTPDFAYERMTATKARYGKRGGTVAYHGYQSFKPGGGHAGAVPRNRRRNSQTDVGRPV